MKEVTERGEEGWRQSVKEETTEFLGRKMKQQIKKNKRNCLWPGNWRVGQSALRLWGSSVSQWAAARIWQWKRNKLSRECMFLGSLSHHNKDLEWRTLKPPQSVTALGSWTDLVIALRQISVTALFYLEDSRKIHLWGVRARRSFGSSFYMFLSP